MDLKTLLGSFLDNFVVLGKGEKEEVMSVRALGSVCLGTSAAVSFSI